jgi:hypothetical protein
LVGEPRRNHRCHPAPLAKTDQVDPHAKIVDRDNPLGEVICRMPVFPKSILEMDTKGDTVSPSCIRAAKRNSGADSIG